ncbi:hypothetical protein ATJ93_2494 [Halopiger aswanensis]|uniref:Uncharacterized protein n=2 Tax=Halopiger aswanensis TaxID=148449 RepID=A0A419WJJ5_9EURY|nr:hypothetical protein ATJ93_2494 [Halopiger aswanensis]
MTPIETTWIKYRVQDIDVKTNERETYYRVKLPSVFSALDLDPGDTIRLEWMEEGEQEYIRAVKTEEEGPPAEGYYKVHTDNYVEIPKRWNENFPEKFYQAAVEANLSGEPHFRIYDPLDYGLYRASELSDIGYRPQQAKKEEEDEKEDAWELIESKDGVIDLASRTPFDGQKVRIVPVEPVFDPLIQEADGRWHGDNISVTSDDVVSVTEDHSIPPKNLDKLGVRWEQELSSSEDIEKLRTHSKNRKTALVFKGLKIETKDVILPKKGGFGIWGAHSGRLGYSWLAYTGGELQDETLPKGNPINSEWGGKYFDASESDESCIKLYLPIPFIKGGDPGIWWT